MQIRDLELKTGLDRSTIRFYEKQGFIKPIRQDNGYRIYSEEDCGTLLKIKLMRQLGMPLEKIKALQEGSEDFAAALKEQVRMLEQQIQAADRSKEVCAQMLKDEAAYQDLNAAYYLELLSRPSQNLSVQPEFRENLPREYHPIRRFAARYIDCTLLDVLIKLLLIVVLRIRPFGDFLSFLVGIGALFLMVPIDALLLSHFGTTPGKWVMGLSVESVNGGKLSRTEALSREWEVLRDGLGFGIPIWEFWRLYKSYKQYGNQANLDWDMECEYRCDPIVTKKKAAFAGMICCILVLNVLNARDLMKPRYRGEDLTIAQFASNYNYYLYIYQDGIDTGDQLQKDGTRYPIPENSPRIYIGGQPQYENQSFDYTTENGVIRRISYRNSWSEVFYMDPIPDECLLAAIASLMAQDGIYLNDLTEFAKLLDEAREDQSGSIQYQNIEVAWNIETENCEMTDQRYVCKDDTLESYIELEFVVTIHNT